MPKSKPTDVRQQLQFAVLALLACSTWTGCAALHPISGISVDCLPPEYKARSRDGMKTIDLSLLRRERPSVHVVDAGDVLAIHISGVFISPDKEDMPPVNIPRNDEIAPSTGFPVPVRDDGTISIPIAGSIHVRGMTIRQVEDMLRRKFVDELQVLKTGRDRIMVNLLKPRQYRVLVIRQESSSGLGGGGGPGGAGAASGGGGISGGAVRSGSVSFGATKRGTGMVVSLPAYENDVLHALANTQGLPGLDAENAIYVIRGTRGCSRLINNNFRQPSSGQGWNSQPVHQPAVEPIEEPAVEPELSTTQLNKALWGPGVQIRGQSPDTIQHATWNIEGVRNRVTQVGGWDLLRSRSGTANSQATIGHSNLSQYPLTSEALPIPAYSASRDREVVQISIGDIAARKTEDAESAGPTPANSVGAVLQPPVADDEYQGFDENNNYSGQVGIEGFGMFNQGYTIESSGTKRIPIRLYQGEVPQFTCEDITLEDGDIIFVESRDSEIYYTSGLLGGGQFRLPRDYDIDIIEAISLAQSSGNQQGRRRNIGGISALNQDVSISASEAIILRKLPHGQQVRIKIDLYKAVRCPTERILIMPGDFIILQFTKAERCWAFVERHLFEGALLGLAASAFNSNN